MTHIIFVVSRDHLDLVPEIERDSRGGSVEIIVDRRRRERRKRSERTVFPDRRQLQRRNQSNSRDLDFFGIAVAVIH